MICKQGCKPNWRWSDILAINAIQFPSSLRDGKVPRSHLTWVLCAAYDSTRHFLATPLHSSRSTTDTTVHPLSATFCGILSPSLIQPLTPSERMMLDASGKFAGNQQRGYLNIPKHWKNPAKSVLSKSFKRIDASTAKSKTSKEPLHKACVCQPNQLDHTRSNCP